MKVKFGWNWKRMSRQERQACIGLIGALPILALDIFLVHNWILTVVGMTILGGSCLRIVKIKIKTKGGIWDDLYGDK